MKFICVGDLIINMRLECVSGDWVLSRFEKDFGWGLFSLFIDIIVV